tara:strand:- start:1433 stop:1546 length:114 start_codon:yes stop_codon:yes gene_type:complete
MILLEEFLNSQILDHNLILAEKLKDLREAPQIHPLVK